MVLEVRMFITLLFVCVFVRSVHSSVQESINLPRAFDVTLPSSGITDDSSIASKNGTAINSIQLRAFIQRPKRGCYLQLSEKTYHSKLPFIPKPANKTRYEIPIHIQHSEASTGLHASIDRHDESMEIDIESYFGPHTIYPIKNALFDGHLCILIRDHPNCQYNFDNETNVYFELQFQGKFKRKLEGPLYMAMELPQTSELKISWPLRTILNAAIRFIKSWGYEFIHISYGGGKGGDTPHLSSPAFQAFDRLVITQEGDEPPLLGYAITEKYEDTVRRKNFDFDHRIDTSCTYTMTFNHTFANVAEWKVHGIPIVKSIDLGFTNDLRLVVYEIDEDDDEGHNEGGYVQAIAKSAIHRKKDIAWWVHFQRRCD